MKLRNRLIILFSLIAMIPFLLISIISYQERRETIKKEAFDALDATAQLRKNTLELLLVLRLQEARMLATKHILKSIMLIKLREQNGEKIDRVALQRDVNIFMNEDLEEYKNTATYYDFIFISKNGIVQLASDETLIGTDLSNDEGFIRGMQENHHSNLFLDTVTGNPAISTIVGIPPLGGKGEPIGVVIATMGTKVISGIVTDREGLGDTGDAYLLDKDLTMITAPYLDPKGLFKTSIITAGNKKALSGQQYSNTYDNYKGVPVIGISLKVTGMDWVLVSEIDAQEAFAPIYKLRNTSVIIGLIVLGLSTLVAIWISTSFSKPISQAVQVANNVALGDMTSKINISSVPEFGELGKALARMQKNMKEVSAVALAASDGNYDQSVQVRSDKDHLARSINNMMEITKNNIWMEKGISKMAMATRDNKVKTIAENTINQLVPYLQAQVGTVYIFDPSVGVLRFIAGYAFKKKGSKNLDLRIGEGLAGQVALEKKSILFKDIPKNYLNVNSALGESIPKNIIVVPLMANEELKGVMEIGSVHEINSLQQQLLINISNSIAIAIETAESKQVVQALLSDSQTNNEKMQKIQLELNQQIRALNKAAIVSETDANGNITFVNDFFCEISEFSKNELIGRNHRMLKSGKQKDALFVGMWKAISSGHTWQGEIVNKKKGGGYYWVDTTIMPFKGVNGEIEKYVAVRFDLTKQKEQQIALKKQAEELTVRTEELRVSEEELMQSNAELEEKTNKLQISEEELRRQQQELLQSNQELKEKGQLLEEKNQIVNEKNINLRFAREKLEHKAEELELNSRYKSEFLANMSHELRTPLNSILLLSRLLSENNGSNLTDEQVELARVIHNSGNGLLELINEILDLSKIESGKMDVELEEIRIKDISKSLNDIFGSLAKEKKIKYSCSITSKAPHIITTDRMRLEQVLKNLLSNALKFTEKGEVKLRIYTPPKRKYFHSPKLKTGEVVAYAVSDTGIGIPDNKKGLVFEAFQQADGSTSRQFGGTGLGLSISREIARLLGGEIELESKEGKGSIFTLYLPVHSTDATSPTEEITNLSAPILEKDKEVGQAIDKDVMGFIPDEIPDDRDNISDDDKVIMIVEDDIRFAQGLVKFVHKRGYKAVVSVSGGTAPGYARKYQPIGILLDIQLPVKSGWTVMRELKEHRKTRFIPVHLMSALDVSRKESVELGAVGFIGKPLAEKQINKVLDKLQETADKHPKKILLIEDNKAHQLALKTYISNHSDIKCLSAYSAKEGMEILNKKGADSVILDMGLPDENGYELLEKIRKHKKFETLPVIVYTGKSLSLKEEQRIKKYASTIVIKTADSYQRLMDELTLFLHLIENGGDKEGETKRKPYVRKKALSKKKILVVDDDMRNIFGLTKTLEDQNMVVMAASNGNEALEILKEHPDTSIVLMDMMMPEKDGYQTMEEIRTIPQWKDLPILAVTAKAMLGDRQKCIDSGASDYISKPVDTDQLLSLLRVWLHKK